MSQHDPEVVKLWRQNLQLQRHLTKEEDPGYFYNEPRCLLSKANVRGFMLGIGDDIFTRLQPALEAAQFEIIFVTCFWAPSSSLERLGESLKKLSEKALESGNRIKVHIGFSSMSLLQKLFQTSNTKGRIYSKASWASTLGLPHESALRGLDLEIKSVFVRPFSVMHPKFVVIDRKEVWLPSCNVSWESWLEGCVVMDGPIVSQFVCFWQHFWARTLKSYDGVYEDSSPVRHSNSPRFGKIDAGMAHFATDLHLDAVYSAFLPSPHHWNPRFAFLPLLAPPKPPSTPLNQFLLSLFSSARSSIFIQTPNFTSPPVLTAVLAALRRGVNVRIVTNERLMLLEQIVTAGSTTVKRVKQLVKRYEQHKAIVSRSDDEAALQQPGSLQIDFFQAYIKGQGEPLHSHFKLSIVDEEWVVLGSGNMDRASWYTSQELGVAFQSIDMAETVKSMVDRCLVDRVKPVYPI